MGRRIGFHKSSLLGVAILTTLLQNVARCQQQQQQQQRFNLFGGVGSLPPQRPFPAAAYPAYAPIVLRNQYPAGFQNYLPSSEGALGADGGSYLDADVLVQGYGDGILGTNLLSDSVASATMTGPAGVSGNIVFFQGPTGLSGTAAVRVVGAVTVASTGLQNLVVTVHENPDTSNSCANIGRVYNPGGFFYPDGGYITRTASSTNAGHVRLNLETSKLLGGVSWIANRRSVAITNGGQILACGVIQSA